MRMKKWMLSVFVMLPIYGAIASAHALSTSSQMPGTALALNQGDVCHVYVVDVAKARKALDEYHDTGNPEADTKTLASAQTVFTEFTAVVGEEVLTTKTYQFPGSNLVITASVYYTDESMASSEGADSMLLGIAVSAKAQEDATTSEDNAVAEMTLNERDIVRAKKFLRVNGRLYLVGIECHCKETNELK
jgi:hypothetical protein